MTIIKWAAVFVGLSVAVTSGCEKKETKTTTAEYSQLQSDYNALVKKYNAQTGRNVENDKVIQLATLNLKELDDAFLDYKNSLEISYKNVGAKQCTEARTVIEGTLKNKLEIITTKANALSQGTLVKALDRMSEDLSSYKDGTQDSVRLKINAVRERMDSGLSGMKSFAMFSHNQLIVKYNEVCATERAPSPAPAPAAAPVPGPSIYKDSVVTVDPGGKRELLSRDDLRSRYRGTYDEKAYSHFDDIAKGSGGFVGFSPTPELFSKTVDVVLQSILEKAGTQTDVAIVLDTTSSMSDDISDVKKNMASLLAKLKEKSAAIGLKLSLVLYRDKDDEYVVKIAQDFTSDIVVIDAAIQSVRVAGGGDLPEAVIDALDKTLRDLSWRPGASRSVVLIGDAPGHETSYSGLSTGSLVENYKRAGLGIIVYPILVSR